MISEVGWGHCVLSSLLSPKRLERRPSLDSCALASAPHDAYARVLLLRALVFNRYLISLCADGASAHVQLNRLAGGLIDASRSSALLLPILADLEEQAACGKPSFRSKRQKQGLLRPLLSQLFLLKLRSSPEGRLEAQRAQALRKELPGLLKIPKILAAVDLLSATRRFQTCS